MKIQYLRRLTAILVGLLLSVPGHAAVIYDNGAPNRDDGIEITGTIGADDFTLATATTLRAVRFWDMERGSTYSGSITWSIYADDPVSNQPGALLFRGNQTAVTRTELGVFGFQGIGHLEVQNDFSVGAVPLGPGKYWLGLHNGPLSNDSFAANIIWESAADNTTATSKFDQAPFDTGGWTEWDIQQAFVLFDANPIPEPSAILLVGIALAGFGLSRRKRAVVEG
jgi:hypothetical protein